jgi:S1-C subfamily serine protease
MRKSHGTRILIGALIALTVGVVLVAGFTWKRSRDSSSRAVELTPRLSLLPTPAFAQTTKVGETVVLADIAERVVPSVVNISSEKIVRDTGSPPDFGPLFNDPFFRHFFGAPMEPSARPRERREHSLGSGVIVSETGIVLTNNHVIENADEIRVGLADGREFQADIVGRDPDSDLGVLKLKGDIKDLKALPVGDSSILRLGDIVLAVGNPFGVGQTVTMGIVSARGAPASGSSSMKTSFRQTRRSTLAIRGARSSTCAVSSSGSTPRS